MSRWVPLLLLALSPLMEQDQKNPPKQDSKPAQGELKKDRPKPAVSEKEEIPPEEDTSVAVQNYSYNPLLSQRNIAVGIYYSKKGNWRAAANRFRDATKYDDANSDAWLKLAEAEEKLKDRQAAKEAYQQYVKTASDAKTVAEIRKKLQKMK